MGTTETIDCVKINENEYKALVETVRTSEEISIVYPNGREEMASGSMAIYNLISFINSSPISYFKITIKDGNKIILLPVVFSA